jgi:threonyl-tRNA synthetase
MLVVGAKEKATNTVSLRRRGKGNLGSMPLERVLEQIKEETSGRATGKD